MARTIPEIKQEIIDAKNAEASLSELNSPSQTAVWNLWAYITASAINLHEQLVDVFKAETEELIKKAVPGTPEWLRQKAFEFQYDQDNPQIVQLVDFYPTYVPVDETKRIVTACSVKQQSDRKVKIKVAKGTPPNFTALSNMELVAIKNYFDRIKFAGTAVDIISLVSDKLKVSADIYYLGQYVEANVKAAVIDAIEGYLSNLEFDGVVYVQKIVDAIQAVEGVKDVVMKEIKAHENGVLITSNETFNMVINKQLINKEYETKSGYIVTETTAGHTPEDTISMVPA